MAKKIKQRKEANKNKAGKVKEVSESKTFAFLATFLSIIGFVIALIAKKDDEYVMFYAKQSLVIFIVAVIAGIATGVLGWIPVLGWIIAGALNILVFVLWLLSWIYALSGDKKEVPVVGKYGRKFNF